MAGRGGKDNRSKAILDKAEGVVTKVSLGRACGGIIRNLLVTAHLGVWDSKEKSEGVQQ